MIAIPDTIEGAKVFCHTAVDERHCFTGRPKKGAASRPAAGLAICRYPDDERFYLFGCDAAWNCECVTCHTTLQEAQDEAEFFYKGTGETWVSGNLPLNKCGVIERIREAFKGVRLEDGVGLSEGRAMDDYADEATLKACREEDERMDWEAIPVERLRCLDTLSFMDEKGMRFHLPAFIIANLEGAPVRDPVFHLTHPEDFSQNKFALFSRAQRAAVRNYLLLIVYKDEYQFDRASIEKALKNYWGVQEV